MRRAVAIVVFVVPVTVSAYAQEMTASISVYKPFGLYDLDGELPLSTELRLTLPISDRFAVEPHVTIAMHQLAAPGNEGLYGFQIRQLLTKDAVATRVFVTYGVAGYYWRSRLTAPLSGQFGIAVRQRLLKHLAFRSDVELVTFHVVPIGVRFAAGFSLMRR